MLFEGLREFFYVIYLFKCFLNIIWNYFLLIDINIIVRIYFLEVFV